MYKEKIKMKSIKKKTPSKRKMSMLVEQINNLTPAQKRATGTIVKLFELKSVYPQTVTKFASKMVDKNSGGKRPLNSYMLYSTSIRSDMKKENPGDTIGEISKKIATSWDTLDYNEKLYYENMAKNSLKAFNLKKASKLGMSVYKGTKKSLQSPVIKKEKVSKGTKKSLQSPVIKKEKVSNKKITVLNYNDFTDIDNTAHAILGGGNKKSFGLYNGEKYVLKEAKSQSLAANEVLASKLYKLANLEVPDLKMVVANGDKYNVAGKFKQGYIGCSKKTKQDEDVCLLIKYSPEKIGNLLEGFLIDCWLANWDVVGLEYDNIGCGDKKCSKAFRVDVGGALLYRALGQPKGKLFNSIPTEHKTLLDEKINPQSALVFEELTPDILKKSASLLQKVNDSKVKELVNMYKPYLLSDSRIKDQVDNLEQTLLARKKYLLSLPQGK